MEFLYTQKRMDILEMRNILFLSEVFAKKDNAEYQFKLKKLSLKECFEKGFENENLKDFLSTQMDSVEILELGGTFSNDIYEFILNNFENVKILLFDLSDFPTDLSFYKRIKTNKNVTKLIINGEIEDTVQYCTILSLFSNVNDIRFLSGIPFEVLSCLPKCYNPLTSLSLYNLSRDNYQNLILISIT